VQGGTQRVELDTMVPLPGFRTSLRWCAGYGLAVCPALGLLVTSGEGTPSLGVFRVPTLRDYDPDGRGLSLVATLGGRDEAPPLDFSLGSELGSGWLAFTGPAAARVLLVSDCGKGAVHVVDVVRLTHVGYVAAPGSISGPRGVAARGRLTAVSAFQRYNVGDHAVHLFEGSGASWTPLRVLAGGFGAPGPVDGQLNQPKGLRFSADGAHVAVADWCNDRVSVFRVSDGAFMRHAVTEVGWPQDVEEVGRGWLTACQRSDTVEFVGHTSEVDGAGRAFVALHAATLGATGTRHGRFRIPTALALLPDGGLVVREMLGARLQVFASPDAVAMSRMSVRRLAFLLLLAGCCCCCCCYCRCFCL
jgi:hypothetical protein